MPKKPISEQVVVVTGTRAASDAPASPEALENRIAEIAAVGWKSQHTGEPKPIGSPDNLFETLPGDPGTHGRFDDRSRPRTLWTDLRLALPRALARVREASEKRPLAATMGVTRRASGPRSSTGRGCYIAWRCSN